MKTVRALLAVLLTSVLVVGILIAPLGCNKNQPTEPLVQDNPQGVVIVQVSDSQEKPVEGAQGTIANQTAISDVDGRLTFANIPNGEHPLLITKESYAPVTKQVLVPDSTSLSVQLSSTVTSSITITSIAVNSAMMMSWPATFQDGDVVTIYGQVSGLTNQRAVSVLDEISLMCKEAPVDLSGGAFNYSLTIHGNGVYSIHFCYNGAHALASFTVAASPVTNAQLQALIPELNALLPATSNVSVSDIRLLANDGSPITGLTLGHPWGLQIDGLEDVTDETAPYILFSEAFANNQVQYGGTIMYDRQLFSFPQPILEKATSMVQTQIQNEMKKNPAANLMNELLSNPIHATLYGVTGLVCYTPTLHTKVACGIMVSMSRTDLIQAGITTAVQNISELSQDQRNLISGIANLGVSVRSFLKSGAGISIFDGRLALRSKVMMLAKYIDGTLSGISAINRNTLVTFNSSDGSFAFHLLNSDDEVVILPWYDQVKSISISPTSYSMSVGGEKHFLAESRNEQGMVLNAHPYYRVDGSIGTIDSEGLFTATTVGSGSVVGWLPPFFNVLAAVAPVTVTSSANHPPVVTVPATASATVNVPVTITFTKSDPDGNAVQVAVDCGDQTGVEWVQGTSYTHTFRWAGVYNVRFTAYDGALWSPTAICIVTVAAPANTAPTACWTYSPQAVTTATPVTLDATCSSDLQTAGSALQVRWQIDGVWSAWTTSKILTKQWATTGTKTVILEVKDAGGLTGQATKTISVSAPANRPPVVTVPATASATTNVPITITLVKSDPDGNAVQVAVDPGNQIIEWIQGSNYTHTFTVVGIYSVRFTAYDGALWSPTAICVVTVAAPANTPPTPCFTVSPASNSGTTATTFLFDAQCSSDRETPADALQVRWQINGTWRPYTTLKGITNQWSTPGTYTVVLEVKDAGGLTAQTTKTVTVSAATVPLVIQNSAIPNGNLQSNYSVTFTCTGGTNGYSVTWYISGSPSGLTFRNNADRTATLSGIPSAMGSYPFTVTVRDLGNAANTVSKQFTLIVNPAINTPPTVNAPNSATGQVGVPTTIPYSVVDQQTPLASLYVAIDWLDGSPISYFWGGAPAIHVFNSTGTYGVRITAFDGTNWSATSTCYVTITSGCSNMPTLLGPTNGQTVSLSAGFSFTWTQVCSGMGRYNLYVMTAPNASGTTVFASAMDPAQTSLRYWGNNLQSNTTYYWCLQMGNYQGAPLTPFSTFRTAP